MKLCYRGQNSASVVVIFYETLQLRHILAIKLNWITISQQFPDNRHNGVQVQRIFVLLTPGIFTTRGYKKE